MDTKIFNHPRPKKSILPPLSKKRKTEHAIEEISFDFSAREDFLTGFHKRKVARHKQAQLENEKKAKQEKIVMRKQLREERTAELKSHVAAVSAALEGADFDTYVESGSDGEWGGIADDSILPEPIYHEAEYIDEDKYTTVTVEAVDVSKEGLKRIPDEEDEEEEGDEGADGGKVVKGAPFEKDAKGKKVWPKKVRKKKFTYESKAERKFTRSKQKAGNKAKADARKGD